MKAAPAVLLSALLVGGCGGSSAPTPTFATPTVLATQTPLATALPGASAAATETADQCEVGEDELPAFATCQASFINADEPTPPFAKYTIPGTGWRAFNGTYKDVEGGDGIQRVGLLFVTITNLTIDACTQQRPADPPIGPSVADLAAGLAALRPFEVTAPPTDVTAFGYAGKHLELRVPLDQPSSGFEMFTGCGDHLLKTWISPGHVSFAFNGYTTPGDTEEFWILDVEGRRLVISALTSAKASAELMEERQAVIDSVAVIP
jgi:hypothetical protein